jgi:folate-binding protein YgfZ
VAVEELGWSCVAVRGPRSAEVDPGACGAELVGAVDWGGLPGVDLLGPDVGVPDGIPEAGVEALEAVRIEAGWPAMGRELDDSVIPAEAGQWLIDASVSFTKGCYTGQELVARVDSRGGNTPRRLRGVVLDAAVAPPEGAVVVVDGDERGRLTSVGASPGLGATIALAYVHRSVAPPADAVVRWDGDDAPARILELPLVGGAPDGGA